MNPLPTRADIAREVLAVAEANRANIDADLLLWNAIHGTIGGFSAAPEQVLRTGVLTAAAGALIEARKEHAYHTLDLETLITIAASYLNQDFARTGELVARDAADLLTESWFVNGQFIGGK